MTVLTKTDIKNRINRIVIRIAITKDIAGGIEDLMKLSMDIHKEVYGEATNNAERQRGDVRESHIPGSTTWGYPSG